MNEAIRYVLDQAGWKAGDANIAFQPCDDSTAQAAVGSGQVLRTPAYSQNPSLVGVIGTFNSVARS